MNVEEILEEHNAVMEDIKNRIAELKNMRQKRTHKDFVTLAVVFFIELPFAFASAFGLLRPMPLHLIYCIVCSFCVGMAYQRYLDAKHDNTPDR